MVLDEPGRPLQARELPDPSSTPAPGRGARRGPRLRRVPHRPAHPRRRGARLDGCRVIPGHQIVATVLAAGADARARAGRRASASRGWAGPTGRAASARSGRENLCERARFTGLDLDGGYATRAVADARYAFALPEGFGDLEAAPLLCAGLIGHRALRMTGDAAAPRALRLRRQRAHRLPGRAATRAGACSPSRAPTTTPRRPSRSSSAASGRATRWARAPEELDAAIIFAPVGALVPAALRAVGRGGVVVCAGIHMSDIPSFPYEILWGERVAALGGQPHARRRRSSSSTSRRACRCART